MKTEFDLNNLTDADVQILEEAISRRKLKMCNPDSYTLFNQAISAGFRPHELYAIVAPNYGNIERSVFAKSRQSGKSEMLWELIANSKPYLEFEYTSEIPDQIEESHEQYNAIFNQFRRMKYLPKIELKIGNKYEIKLGDNIKHLYLIRIEGNIKYFPELYFSVHDKNKTGMNISAYKILKEIKE